MHYRVAVRWWLGNRTDATQHFTGYRYGYKGSNRVREMNASSPRAGLLGGGLSLGGGLGGGIGGLGNTNKGMLGGLNLAGTTQKSTFLS